MVSCAHTTCGLIAVIHHRHCWFPITPPTTTTTSIQCKFMDHAAMAKVRRNVESRKNTTKKRPKSGPREQWYKDSLWNAFQLIALRGNVCGHLVKPSMHVAKPSKM